MKCIRLLICFLILSLCILESQAQKRFFVGGGFSYSQRVNKTFSDFKSTEYSIAPNIGMFVSDKFVVGIGIGFVGNDTKNGSLVTIESSSRLFNPFVRFRKPLTESFGLFGELGVSVGNGAVYDLNLDQTNDFSTFSVYATPGIDYALAKNWLLIGKWGRVGYYNSSGEIESLDESSFAIDLEMSSVLFGVIYCFN